MAVCTRGARGFSPHMAQPKAEIAAAGCGGSSDEFLADFANRAGLPLKDAKSLLNNFCHKLCKRILSKDDIAYVCTEYDHQFQATVTLQCFEGVQIAGELCATSKEASQSAAMLALQHLSPQIETLVSEIEPRGTKRKGPDEPTVMTKTHVQATTVSAPVLVPARRTNTTTTAPVSAKHPGGVAPTCRGRLNEALTRLFARTLTKEDIVYETEQTSMGFQSKLFLPHAPEEWACLAWVGDVANNKKGAEESAASYSLEALFADPVLAAELAAPRVQPSKGKKGTGGKGQSKGYKGILQPKLVSGKGSVPAAAQKAPWPQYAGQWTAAQLDTASTIPAAFRKAA